MGCVQPYTAMKQSADSIVRASMTEAHPMDLWKYLRIDRVGRCQPPRDLSPSYATNPVPLPQAGCERARTLGN